MDWDRKTWRDVPGYSGIYSVSRDGRIFSHTSNREMSKTPDRDGYLLVSLSNCGRVKKAKIHRVVIESWGDVRPSPKHECNHINGDKADNRVENLEWVTRAQNMEHRDRVLNKVRRRPVIATALGGNFSLYFDSIKSAVKSGFMHSCIVLCCQGKSKFHSGYAWSYADVR